MNKTVRLFNEKFENLSIIHNNNLRFFFNKSRKKNHAFFSLPSFIFFLFKKNLFLFFANELDYKIVEIYSNNFLLWINSLNKKVKQKLILKGLGFRSYFSDDKTKLLFKLGYSHIITLDIPTNIFVTLEKNLIILEGFNLVKVGTFSKKIKNLRKLDVYKNKGFSSPNEFIKRKQIKKS